VLWEREGLTVSEVGERLSLDSGTLTPLLKRLQTSGLLARQRDTEDERRVMVRLTPAGRALKARAAKVPPQVACATACSIDELNSLTQRLKTLRDEITAFSTRAAA
jgi:DNA-binding MarR family transcriptional regulator